jgi:hypothetical protein
LSQNSTDDGLPLWCQRVGGITLGNVSTLPSPWLAQLQSPYNTGLIKQFLPRFNFTVTRENVTADSMPKKCANLPGAFHVRYPKLGVVDWMGSGNWSIEICMPANQNSTPWKSTRLRQDFTEELYLNILVVGYELGFPSEPQTEGGTFKITSHTTAGYFELPNYINGGKAGPLLTGDPSDHGGLDCYAQGTSETPIYDHNITPRSVNITGGVMNESYTALSLDAVANKGPLLTVALALLTTAPLFMPASNTRKPIYTTIFRTAHHGGGTCVDQAPLGL